MRRFRDKRKVISLTLVGVAYALIVLPLIINNIQKQQELRSKAQVTDTVTNSELNSNAVAQSSQLQCISTGEVEIGTAYTNIDQSRPVIVTATDEISGQSVSLGTIAPGETKTATITTSKSTLQSGIVKFTVAYEDQPQQTSQTSATYLSKSCAPYSPATLTNKVSADVAATCGNVTTDVILVIDRSASMGQANKLVQAKNAAKNFIDVVSKQQLTTKIGLVSFSTTGTLNNTLSSDFNGTKSKIDALSASGGTCQECGIAEANKEIAAKGRTGVKKVVIMLTDGQANHILGNTKSVNTVEAEAKALDAVKNGFQTSNTVFFTIGLGDSTSSGDGRFFSPDYMRQVASLTGGKFYFPAPSELDGVYQEISQLIGKGLLGGFVFNDINLNGAYDTNEPKLSGWTINAVSTAGTKTAVSDSSGNYTIAGLCDGSYKLSQTLKPGWTQKLPPEQAGYSVNINNASQFNDKLFGNTDKARCNDTIDNDNNGFKDTTDSTCHSDGNPKNPNSYVPLKDGEHGGGNTCADSIDNNGDGTIDGGDPVCHTDKNPQNPNSYNPNLPEISPTPTPIPSPTLTPTPTLGVTSLFITVLLDGIGSRGDNANPNDSSLSNKNPKNPTIPADIQIYSLNNQLISSSTAKITYSSATGMYTGEIPVQQGFLSGQYNVKIKGDTYLRRLVNGIQTISAGQKNKITTVPLVAGDVTNDNKLNILDYNSILECYSDIAAASNCPSSIKNINSDINDDGIVNQIDYNLFLREIATQPGQ